MAASLGNSLPHNPPHTADLFILQVSKWAQLSPQLFFFYKCFLFGALRLSHVLLPRDKPPAPLPPRPESTSASRCLRLIFSASLGLIMCLTHITVSSLFTTTLFAFCCNGFLRNGKRVLRVNEERWRSWLRADSDTADERAKWRV